MHGCKWSCRTNISKIVKLKTNLPTKKQSDWWTEIGEMMNNCDFGFWTFCWGPQKNGGCFSDPQSPATFLFNRFLWPHSASGVLKTHHPYKKSECLRSDVTDSIISFRYVSKLPDCNESIDWIFVKPGTSANLSFAPPFLCFRLFHHHHHLFFHQRRKGVCKPKQLEPFVRYDTMEHFIKPATEEKQCSYVELVASGPQLAQWCLGLDWVVVDSWTWGNPGRFGSHGPFWQFFHIW